MSARPAWQGDDFPSWLSPMIVKELRQGLASGAFAWTFIGLQVVMFLVMSWAFLALGQSDAVRSGVRGSVDFFFWSVTTVAVVLAIPLRALGSISGEQAGNSLDLIRLTRLSATRIVVGKWLAVLAQGALVTTAVAPYIVLRHFFGGVNVLGDLEVVGWLFALSAVVAAAALALSTQPVRSRIALILLGQIPLVGLLETGIIRGPAALGAAGRIGVLAALAVYTVACLEFAAARIAPVSENHAARSRTLALVIATVWIVLAAAGSSAAVSWPFLVTTPLLLAYAVEAIGGVPVHVRSQAAAFARSGVIGRVAARLLTPGWPSGLVFVILLAALAAAGIVSSAGRLGPMETGGWLAAVSLLLAAVVYPLPLLVFWPRLKNRALAYGIVQLVSFMLFVYTQSFKPSGVGWADWTAGRLGLLPFPAAALACLSACGGRHAESFITAGLAVTALVLVVVVRPWLRAWRHLERALADCRPDGLGGGARDTA